VNIEAGVVTEFDAVPVLRRTGGKLPGMNHHFFSGSVACSLAKP
jgi:hypothetical protein